MLTMNSLGSQTDLNTSAELGAVIEQMEAQALNFKDLAVVWVVGTILLMAICWPGTDWYIIGSMFFASTTLLVVAISHKILSGISSNLTFRVHENGLSLVQAGGSTIEIPYCQLDEYCCKKLLVFRDDCHVDDHYHLEVKSYSFDADRIIKWSANSFPSPSSDNKGRIDFNALHFRASEKVADNMAAALEADQKVPWGKSAFICENGIEAKEKTGVFAAEMRFISWSELSDMKFQNGKLLLSFEPGTWNVQIPADEPNLLAGYLLVKRLMKTRYEHWLDSQQSEQEMAITMAERYNYYVSPNTC